MRSRILSAAVAAALFQGATAFGETAIVSNIKVLSDKVEDVSSLDAWQKSVIKPEMKDAEKALAAWETAVKFRHHDVPDPREYLHSDPIVYDPIKLFNVYGYCTGKGAQPAFLQLVRHLGYPARNMSIFRFGVPEVQYDNAWHMYDVGMINYFPKPDGAVASVEELVAAVKAWHKENPGYHDNGNKLKAYMKNPGMKSGPALVANCPTLQPSGSYPSSNFGWYSTMIIYDVEKPPFVYEEPYSQGYRVNNQLRRGEKLTFNWSNKGLHVNMLDEKNEQPVLKAVVGKGQLNYTPKFGDLANGRIGNGTLEYNPPLESLKDVAITYDNLVIKDNALHPADPGKPATLVLDMPCSYVYLAGTLNITSPAGESGSYTVQISDNHGLDWKDLAKTEPSPGSSSIDLQKAILRRYNYRLKFTLNANVSIRSIHLTHDFQHSQRALPALDKGDNTITFSAGPHEGTVSIEPAAPKHKEKQPTTAGYKVVMENVTESDAGHLTAGADNATVTYPVETPGPITRIRFGSQYRAANKAAWHYQVSFDSGKTFTTAHTTKDHNRFDHAWVAFDKIPPNTRSALVRFQATAKDNILFHPRIDADYAHPNGGFAPVNVTYVYDEAGQEKRHQHTAKTPAETYKITLSEKPTLKSLILERAN
jgi:hypothetical protein